MCWRVGAAQGIDNKPSTIARGSTMPVSAVDISHNLKGIDFPADKTHLVDWARQHHANQDVINALQKMPEKEYETMADVERSFGQTK
jgi:hypothetical protein